MGKKRADVFVVIATVENMIVQLLGGSLASKVSDRMLSTRLWFGNIDPRVHDYFMFEILLC